MEFVGKKGDKHNQDTNGLVITEVRGKVSRSPINLLKVTEQIHRKLYQESLQEGGIYECAKGIEA